MKKRHYLVDFLASVGFTVKTEKVTQVAYANPEKVRDYTCRDYWQVALYIGGVKTTGSGATLTGAIRSATAEYVRKTKGPAS